MLYIFIFIYNTNLKIKNNKKNNKISAEFCIKLMSCSKIRTQMLSIAFPQYVGDDDDANKYLKYLFWFEVPGMDGLLVN